MNEKKREYMRAYLKEYRKLHRDRIRESSKVTRASYRKRNSDKIHAYDRLWRRNLRIEAINKYGGCKCAMCPETRIGALTINHIDGGGRQHRSSIGSGGTQFFRWLKNNNYPEGYNVLCSNCNYLEWLNNRAIVYSSNASARHKKKRSGEIKSKLMLLLGGKCAVCCNDDIRVLTIHHVNGDGSSHRKSLDTKKTGHSMGSHKMYVAILKSGTTEGLECRCFSCNDEEEWR